MPNREKYFAMAVEVVFNELGIDPAPFRERLPEMVKLASPIMDQYHEERSIAIFDARFRERFPTHVPSNYGSTVFDYVVGNIQTAVVEEIIYMMENWITTLEAGKEAPRFRREVPRRDWDIACAHMRALISEVKKYRTMSIHGGLTTDTGSVSVEPWKKNAPADTPLTSEPGSTSNASRT